MPAALSAPKRNRLQQLPKKGSELLSWLRTALPGQAPKPPSPQLYFSGVRTLRSSCSHLPLKGNYSYRVPLKGFGAGGVHGSDLAVVKIQKPGTPSPHETQRPAETCVEGVAPRTASPFVCGSPVPGSCHLILSSKKKASMFVCASEALPSDFLA